MDEIDIWRAANEIIKRFGDEAPLIAARRADALLGLGEFGGFQAWTRITKAIGWLSEGRVPQEGGPIH